MKAYIHYVGERSFNVDCASAERGFKKLGISCEHFRNDFDLSNSRPKDVVVAGMLVTEGRLSYLGISPEKIEYPECLHKYLGRTVWQSTLDALLTHDKFPVFIKPVEEKLFKGRVISSGDDLLSLQKEKQTLKLWCSEVVDLKSEWRCYVKSGQILGTIPYVQHNPNSKPNESLIESAVRDLGRHPAGCSLDFGVTSTGNTIFIEANDGYALGNYGLEDSLYASLLLARWGELISSRQ